MHHVQLGSRPTPLQSENTHSATPALSHAESTQIDLCRIIGIFFMIGVHVPPGTREINYLYGGPLDWFWFVYVDTFGRASVAVLSFFGGYLLFLASERKSVAQIARDRAVTIYLPMLTWNFIGVALMIAGGVLALGMPLTDTLAQLELDTIEGALNKMLGLADKPALVPYTFLRDFFVSAVLARLALPLFRKAPLPVLAAVMLVAVFRAGDPVLLRPSILLFLLLGMYAAMSGWRIREMSRASISLPIALGLAVAWTLAELFLPDGASWQAEIPNLLRRAMLVAFLLWASDRLMALFQFENVGRWRKLVFDVYLTHAVTSLVMDILWKASGISYMSPLYVLFYAGCILTFIAVGCLTHVMLNHAPRPLQIIVRGSAPRERRPILRAPTRGLVL